MPGLLKQLQKQKPVERKSKPQEVVVRSEARVSQNVFVLDQVVEDAAVRNVVAAAEGVQHEAEALLAELVAESARPSAAPQSKSKPSRVVKRVATAMPSEDKPLHALDDAAPWWLSEEKEPNPQVEMLVEKARGILEQLRLNVEESKQPEVLVHKATQEAVATLRDEVRISRRVQAEAEKELLLLLVGKGPLTALYEDMAVTDIFIDSHKSIKVLRRGHAIETPFSFRSPEEYRLFIDAMLSAADRSFGPANPIVDCVLMDEWRSRINAIDATLLEGREPRLCIRVPRLQRISFYDILQTKTLPATLAAWLAEVVALGQANLLVLGPTGSGKSVMTTALLSAVNSDERIITIEDVPELFVPTSHLEKLVARPPNADGEGEVTMPDLLRAALRRAPHRIVVGEIRDEEGRLFLRALETGHAGSIATIHADNARDALWRLLDLISSYEVSPHTSIMRRIGRSVHLIIGMKKVKGTPCLVEVSEVLMPEDEEFQVRPLVTYAGEVNGKRRWHLHGAAAEESYWVRKVAQHGLPLAPGPGLSLAPEPDEEHHSQKGPRRA
ncbi:MAG: CpaF family protein [Bdellovibrionales bacterium]|nr:CpaF family protein [Bdellovibrionales bacterium]